MLPPTGLTEFELARATQTTVDEARTWLDGTAPAGQAAKRLVELTDVVDRLIAVGMVEPAGRCEWLANPNRAFEHHAPLDVIARGEHQRVLRYIASLS